MDGFYLLRKGADAVLIHKVSQEREAAGSKNTLLGIDDNPVLAESLKDKSQVCEVLCRTSASY